MKTINQVEEIRLAYTPKVKPSDRPKIASSADIFKIASSVFDSETIEYKESFYVLHLNQGNKVLGWTKISEGGVAGTYVDAKVVFSSALLANASLIILCHNHPSGNLRPSQADIDLTRKIKKAGELLDIVVLDHLIITSESYYSFADECMM